MGEYFEKMFFWEEFLCYYSKDKLNFIGNSSAEKRSENAGKIDKLNEQCKCTYFFLDYDYEEDSFECNNEKYDLKSQTFVFLRVLDKNIPVILNITSMNLRLMGTLLFNIKK